jgi:hypothetical protein
VALTYRDRGEAQSGTQLDILSGDIVICFLHKAILTTLVGQPTRWDWTWRVDYGPPDWSKQGSAGSKDEALAAIEKEWHAWLEAAELAEKTPR